MKPPAPVTNVKPVKFHPLDLYRPRRRGLLIVARASMRIDPDLQAQPFDRGGKSVAVPRLYALVIDRTRSPAEQVDIGAFRTHEQYWAS